jgi:hypothetical protein
MSALDDAMTFLRQHLAGGEPVARKDIQSAAKAAGIAPATLRRARERLGVATYKESSLTGRWYWRLPNRVAGRTRVWLVAEAKASKRKRRAKPTTRVPMDPGWLDGQLSRMNGAA